MKAIRVALVCDFAEENWPSMDLVANMLTDGFARSHSDIEPVAIRPSFTHRFGRLFPRKTKAAVNFDRMLNRLVDYPKELRRIRDRFDLFHIVDHSYSHLVLDLPAGRTVVTCHDLDTFRCVLEPANEPRMWLFRSMTRRILQGFRRAARISCVSDATRAALLGYGLVPADRVSTIHNGISPACSPEPDTTFDRAAAALLGPLCERATYLLHVGSTIARKRIDILLRVFAGLREKFPGIRLVHVGGPFTLRQTEMVAQLNLRDSIVVAPFVNAFTLAAIYRHAALLLMPSDAEGFGLPVAEAMACGTPVLASEIAALREVAGAAASYAPSGDVPAWISSAGFLLEERLRHPARFQARRLAGIEQARRFSWDEAAAKTARLYREVAA